MFPFFPEHALLESVEKAQKNNTHTYMHMPNYNKRATFFALPFIGSQHNIIHMCTH